MWELMCMYIRTHVELETDVLSNKGWYHRQFSMSFYWIFVEQSKCTYMAIETIGQTVRGFDHESLIIHIIAIRKERLKGVCSCAVGDT